MRFPGKVVLVAGGTGGLGRAVSIAFRDEGAKVIVTYRRDEEFEHLESEARGDGLPIEGQRIDVTDESAVRQLIESTLSQHGKLDALVNTVGGYAGGVKLWESQLDALDRMLSMNLRSGYVLARAAVPAFIKQGRGASVNVAAKAAFDDPAGAAAYAASNAAAVARLGSLAAAGSGLPLPAASVSIAARQRFSSRSAITILCTSSGPSASRSMRRLRHRAASGVSSETPSAP